MSVANELSIEVAAALVAARGNNRDAESLLRVMTTLRDTLRTFSAAERERRRQIFADPPPRFSKSAASGGY
ncbi:MAG: hypothetical protein ACRD68_03720 [Pyrinomonadaceae bacterium]